MKIKRLWKCTQCGYSQQGTMSLYLWNKAWKAGHTAKHNA